MAGFTPRIKPNPGYDTNGSQWQQGQSTYQGPRGLTFRVPNQMKGGLKKFAWILVLVFITNLGTHLIFNPSALSASALSSSDIVPVSQNESLYLMEKASLFVPDPSAFENKVREIAYMLDVAPEWLMSVMYSESKFDAAVRNYKGSGATGLIQFMPAAASEMNVTVQRLGNMTHLQQLEYVYLYLQTVRERYGEFQNLTDLYLAILYPKAMGQDYCYTMYASPSKSYKQNSGLDENKDSRVTVSDIDRRMQRLYPTAYIKTKPSAAQGTLSGL